MNVRRGLALGFAVVVFASLSIVGARSQSDGKTEMTSEDPKPLSDLAKNELRGPVRSVIEETTYATVTDADGKVYPESRSSRKTEYDHKGRIAELRFRGASGEWMTRYTYGEAGQLLRATVQNETGKQERETVYQYDEQGRLRSITDSRDPNNSIAFRYDANGRKTKIAIARPVDERQGLGAVSRSMEASFEDAGSAAALPEGGSG